MAVVKEVANKPAVLSTKSESLSCSLKFELNSGNDRTFSFKYVDEEACTDENINAVMDTIIENGLAWNDAPIKKLEAKLTETNTTKFDLS